MFRGLQPHRGNAMVIPTGTSGRHWRDFSTNETRDLMLGGAMGQTTAAVLGVALGPAGKGWEFLAPVLQRGALARCAEMVGCAQRILDMCVDYAKVREQPGRPIGAFQAIQHLCADLLRNVEGSRYILYKAAWSIQAGLESTPDVAMGKAHVSDACLWVARQGHQIMGAISYCEEHPLHLFHKRIRAAGSDFGLE